MSSSTRHVPCAARTAAAPHVADLRPAPPNRAAVRLFPNWVVRHVREPNLKTAEWLKRPVLQFLVSPQMNKIDISEYLRKLYGIPVSKVHTANYLGEDKVHPKSAMKRCACTHTDDLSPACRRRHLPRTTGLAACYQRADMTAFGLARSGSRRRTTRRRTCTCPTKPARSGRATMRSRLSSHRRRWPLGQRSQVAACGNSGRRQGRRNRVVSGRRATRHEAYIVACLLASVWRLPSCFLCLPYVLQ